MNNKNNTKKNMIYGGTPPIVLRQDPFESKTLIDCVMNLFRWEYGKVSEIHEKFTLESHIIMML